MLPTILPINPHQSLNKSDNLCSKTVLTVCFACCKCLRLSFVCRLTKRHRQVAEKWKATYSKSNIEPNDMMPLGLFMDPHDVKVWCHLFGRGRAVLNCTVRFPGLTDRMHPSVRRHLIVILCVDLIRHGKDFNPRTTQPRRWKKKMQIESLEGPGLTTQSSSATMDTSAHGSVQVLDGLWTWRFLLYIYIHTVSEWRPGPKHKSSQLFKITVDVQNSRFPAWRDLLHLVSYHPRSF